MKKLIFTFFALPLILIACSDKGLDRGLDGTWIGEVETSDLDLLSAIGNGQKTSEKALKETLIYKIDGKNVETYRSKNYQTMDNQIEVELGTYHKSKDVMIFDIDRHSCAKIDPTRPLTRKISYKFSQDLSNLTFTFGPNKTITFKRLDNDESGSMEQLVQNATTGCFSGGSFKQGKIEKPNSLNVSQKVDELVTEAQSELKEENKDSDQSVNTDPTNAKPSQSEAVEQ